MAEEAPDIQVSLKAVLRAAAAMMGEYEHASIDVVDVFEDMKKFLDIEDVEQYKIHSWTEEDEEAGTAALLQYGAVLKDIFLALNSMGIDGTLKEYEENPWRR